MRGFVSPKQEGVFGAFREIALYTGGADVVGGVQTATGKGHDVVDMALAYGGGQTTVKALHECGTLNPNRLFIVPSTIPNRSAQTFDSFNPLRYAMRWVFVDVFSVFR
jgi:hypothetical protein